MAKDPHVVSIDEAICIGCTKCIQVCPVDAIVGASKQTHFVIQENCIGCNLCLPPCPVDCINIVPIALSPELRRQQALAAKKRYQARKLRLENARQKEQAVQQKILTNKKTLIAESLARHQQKRTSMASENE